MEGGLLMSATWSELSARLGRRDLPYTLAKAVFIDATLTEPEEICKGVANAWVAPEWPGQALEYGVWQMLFGEALGAFDDCILIDGGEMVSRDELPAELTLWRGAAPGYERGMAWTGDKARAEWFATRFGDAIGGTHVLLEVTVPSEVVLAHFTGRGEDEYVLDLELLDDYIDLEEAA
jgi:hypothetical protein